MPLGIEIFSVFVQILILINNNYLKYSCSALTLILFKCFIESIAALAPESVVIVKIFFITDVFPIASSSNLDCGPSGVLITN